MTSPIETILAVVRIGGRLTPAGDKIRMYLPPDAAPELKAAIRAQKGALRALIATAGRDWLLIRSESLGGVLVFLARDDATKAQLVRMGAHPESVYSRGELAALVAAGAEPGVLLVVHEAKRVFCGTVVPPPANSPDDSPRRHGKSQ